MASTAEKAKEEKGYDHKFVDPVPNELLCLICLLAARDPQQSTCCGKVFCETCVDELKKHSNKCPGCRGDMKCFPDKRSKSCDRHDRWMDRCRGGDVALFYCSSVAVCQQRFDK